MARTRRVAVAWPTILRELAVVGVEDVTAGMRRVILTGDQLAEFDVAGGTAAEFRSDGFDDHVKLLVPAFGTDRPPLPVQGPDRLEWGGAGGRPVAKDYTPRWFDAASRRLALDFVRHGDGFASGWAERVQPGDPAWIVGPTRSLLLPEGVDHLVVAGDETALPAIGRLLDEWPADWAGRVGAHVVVEVADASREQQLSLPDGVVLTQVHGAAAWEQAIAALDVDLSASFCWVAGESGSVRRVRTHLAQERNVPRDLLDATGYWRA